MIIDVISKLIFGSFEVELLIVLELLWILDLDQLEVGIEFYRICRVEVVFVIIKGFFGGVLNFGVSKVEVESVI